MLYTVAIAVHNNLALTKRCIESILRSTDLQEIDLVVVDNGSTDGTREYLLDRENHKGWPPLVGVWNDANKGVGEAYNQALEEARSPYFVALNNDMEILDPCWLSHLRQPFDGNPKMALVGAEGTGRSIDAGGNGIGFCESKDYVEGSLMMARTAIVKKYGLFDPAYRMGYYEDSDLSLRLRKRGYEIDWVKVDHKHDGACTSRMLTSQGVDLEGCYVVNGMTFLKRWAGYLQKDHSFVEHVAIRRSRAMGDVLLITPVIRAMKEENAHLVIDVFTDHPKVFRDNPDVRQCFPAKYWSLIDFSHRNTEYERGIDLDLAYELTPERNFMVSYAEKCGVTLNGHNRPLLFPSSDDRNSAKLLIKDGEKWAAIHPGPWGLVGKTVPTEIMFEVEDYLLTHGWNVYRVTPRKTDTHRLYAILERCQLFVGADSGPMHMAVAARIPVVGIFGWTIPEYIFPPGAMNVRGVTARQDRVGCLGCRHIYPPPLTGSLCLRQGEKNNLCMKQLRSEDIFTAIEIMTGSLK